MVRQIFDRCETLILGVKEIEKTERRIEELENELEMTRHILLKLKENIHTHNCYDHIVLKDLENSYTIDDLKEHDETPKAHSNLNGDLLSETQMVIENYLNKIKEEEEEQSRVEKSKHALVNYDNITDYDDLDSPDYHGVDTLDAASALVGLENKPLRIIKETEETMVETIPVEDLPDMDVDIDIESIILAGMKSISSQADEGVIQEEYKTEEYKTEDTNKKIQKIRPSWKRHQKTHRLSRLKSNGEGFQTMKSYLVSQIEVLNSPEKKKMDFRTLTMEETVREGVKWLLENHA